MTRFYCNNKACNIYVFYDDGYIGWQVRNIESDHDSSEEDDAAADIGDQLAEWAALETVKPSAINKLLKILTPHFPTLPLDSRTLLKTLLRHDVIEIGGGQYCHVGV